MMETILSVWMACRKVALMAAQTVDWRDLMAWKRADWKAPQ